jgi:hypothetical protein
MITKSSTYTTFSKDFLVEGDDCLENINVRRHEHAPTLV